MTNKKWIFWVSLTGMMIFPSLTLQAQIGFNSGSISALLEDNALRDANLRYTSVLSFFEPEEATRLGFTSRNNMLNNRTPETEAQALAAFEAILKSLDEITVKNLSADKQAEYHLLHNAVASSIFALQQNRLSTDPLYYTQALDSVFDLLFLSQQEPARKQRTDLLARVSALPTIVKQAYTNLNAVSPIKARLAMEKTYYALLSFDEIENCIVKENTLFNDERENAQAQTVIDQARLSVQQLFELFKRFSQTDQAFAPDMRLGEANYVALLNKQYQITDKLPSVNKRVEHAFTQAQHNLFEALLPFELSADEQDITVVEDLNQTPLEERPALYKTPQAPKRPAYTAPSATQFYAVAGQLTSPFSLQNILTDFTQYTALRQTELVREKVLPVALPLHIEPLVAYFAYQQPFAWTAAYPFFWLRLPYGNQLAQEEMLNTDFNEPASKLLISQALVPGRYYQANRTQNITRRLFGSATLANGWADYAIQLAKEQGYLVTDEEQLFAAWHDFVRTVSAVVDFRLHTQEYTYEDALAFLTEENGFTAQDAARLIDNCVRTPGEAISYLVGKQLWADAAHTYTKKTKDLGKATQLLLKVGNVDPQDLTKELKRAYKK